MKLVNILMDIQIHRSQRQRSSMVVKKLIIYFVLLFGIQSCNSNQDETIIDSNSKRNAESELLKQLFLEMKENQFEHIDYSEISSIIQKYFFQPEEILIDMENDHKVGYWSKLTFYTTFIEEGSGSLNFYWNDEILNQDKLYWILDEKQCEETLLITYLNEEGTLRDFCTCFRNEKIYSVLPFGNGHEVIWARRLKSIDVEEGVLMVPDDSNY